jgi:predicted naringenin-chalcone synthase
MPLPLAIPAIAAVTLGAFARILTSSVGVVLFQLGISAVTFTGVTIGLGTLKTEVISFMGSLPGSMVTIIGLMRIDQGILILFSAMTAKLALQAVSGAVTRFLHRTPGT